jgi:hypothetical protein
VDDDPMEHGDDDDDWPPAAASAQERFMIMMNERIGALESTLSELRDALRDGIRDAVRGHVATTTVCNVMDVPAELLTRGIDDAAFLNALVDAVQLTDGVVVQEAWCAVQRRDGRLTHHLTSVYLKLESPIVASQASHEMSAHVKAAFANMRLVDEWQPTSLAIIRDLVRVVPFSGCVVTRVLGGSPPT